MSMCRTLLLSKRRLAKEGSAPTLFFRIGGRVLARKKSSRRGGLPLAKKGERNTPWGASKRGSHI